MNPEFLTIDEVRSEIAAHLGVTPDKSTVYRWIRTGVLPPSCRFTPSITRWRRTAIVRALKEMRRGK